jgi:aminopeptidase N
MEYSGFYFLGAEYYAAYDGTPRNYLTAIAAHEVAHQWWYDEVGNDQAHEPWLDEALCIYGELIYYQAAHPDLVNWWWDFRVTRFNPAGWVNASVYDFAAFRPYVNAVYLRGALFMRDLRAAMGDGAFFDFLGRYRAAQSGRVAQADDFWSLLQTYNVPNLARLRATYFTR